MNLIRYPDSASRLTYIKACEAVLDSCPNGYAKAYAKAGLTLTDTEEQRVQALYILSNMSGWRGPLANEVRATLKGVSRRG